jgi:TolB-like protein
VRVAHERGDRTALADARPDLPRRLTRAIEHAIDPQTERRWESAAALTVALRSAQRGSRRRWIVGLAAAAAVVMLWMGQTGRGDTSANRSLADIARAPAASWWTRLVPAKRRAVAVLPFQNLGAVAGSDLMADGLTYQIAAILARVEGLDVRSAASSFTFKDKPRNLATVGSALKVDLAVEGELFAAGDRVRVIAKLVSVPDDVEIGNWTFDRRGKDILEIQTDLAAAIVNTLRLELGGQLRYENDPAVQLKFWTARGLAERSHQSGITKAIGLFEEIVAEAPSYAPAWAGLAGALGLGVRLDAEVPPEAFSRMEEAALQVHKLDPLLAEAHAVLGVGQARNLDWNEAERSFGKALSLNPSLTTIHTAAVLNLLLPLHRLDEAKELLGIARNVDPSSLAVRRSLAHVHVDAGEYEEAIRNAEWVLQRDPGFPFTAIRSSCWRLASSTVASALAISLSTSGFE